MRTRTAGTTAFLAFCIFFSFQVTNHIPMGSLATGAEKLSEYAITHRTIAVRYRLPDIIAYLSGTVKGR
jgi:hypothetical protein